MAPPSDPDVRKSTPGAGPPQSFAPQIEAARRNPNLNFGKVTLLEEIGHGGMGVVYRAWQDDFQRMVAVKVLPANSARESGARFLREARLASRLRHPNIVAVHEMGEHQGRAWFSMDLVEGGSLDPLVRGRKLPVKRMMEILRDVARALEFAHAAGVVHRDIKPANILLGADGKPFLSDFGLAGELEESQGRLTMSGAIMGTPAYMSPEQARGRHGKPDARSDVYALGAVMYEGLTGETPVPKGDLVEIVSAILHTDPPAPASRAKDVPKDAETICLKCLQKDPARRYQTAGALADDIDRFLRGEPIAARASSLLQKASRKARPAIVVGALAGLFVCAVLVWLVKRELGRERALDELRRQLASATTQEEKDRLNREIAVKTGSEPARVERPSRETPLDKPVTEAPEPPRTEALERTIREHVEARDFAKAVGVLSGFAPGSAEETRWRDAMARTIEDEAQAAFDDLDRQAQALLLIGQFDNGLELWRRAAGFGIQRLALLAEDRIAEARRNRAAGAREEALARLIPLREAVLAACASRNYAAAEEAVAGVKARAPEIANDLAALQGAIADAAAAFALAPKGATPLKGRTLDTPGGEAAVLGGDGSGLQALVAGKAQVTIRWTEVPAPLVAELAAAGGATPEQVGAFHLLDARESEARAAWAGRPRAAELDRLAADLHEAIAGRAARSTLDALFKAADAKDWKTVKALLPLRSKHAAAWAGHEERLEEIEYLASEESAAEPFGQKPRLVAGRLEWRYDFASAGALKDWAQAGENIESASGPFGLAAAGGTTALSDANMRFAAPLEGDLRIAFDLEIRQAREEAHFGVFLGGYVWELKAGDETHVYSPGEECLASAEDPGLAAGRTVRAEMVVTGGRVRCLLGGKPVLDAAAASPLMPIPPTIWSASGARIAVDNLVLSGKLYAGWSAEFRARQDLLQNAARAPAEKVASLTDGSSLGKLAKGDGGTWKVADGALRGTSDGDDDACLGFEERELRNVRVRFQYRAEKGRQFAIVLREDGGQQTFWLPMDAPGKWRSVEAIIAEDASSLAVDETLRVDPEDRLEAVFPGHVRFHVRRSSVSIRSVTLEELKGLPATRDWQVLFDGRKPKGLELEGMEWEKDDEVIRGRGSIGVKEAGAGGEWKWMVDRVEKATVRVEAGGETLWECRCPDRSQTFGVRLKGGKVDVFWNGMAVVRDAKPGKAGGVRLVVVEGKADIGGVLAR